MSNARGEGPQFLPSSWTIFLLLTLLAQSVSTLIGPIDWANFALVVGFLTAIPCWLKKKTHYATMAKEKVLTFVLCASILIVEVVTNWPSLASPMTALEAEDNAAWIALITSSIAGGNPAEGFGILVPTYLMSIRGLVTLITFGRNTNSGPLEQAALVTVMAFKVMMIGAPLLSKPFAKVRDHGTFRYSFSVHCLITISIYHALSTAEAFGHLTAALLICGLIWCLRPMRRTGTSPWLFETRLLELCVFALLWRPFWLYSTWVGLFLLVFLCDRFLPGLRLRIPGGSLTRRGWFCWFLLTAPVHASVLPIVVREMTYTGGTARATGALLGITAGGVFVSSLDRARRKTPNFEILVSLVVFTGLIVIVDASFNQQLGYGTTKLIWVVVLSLTPLSICALWQFALREAVGHVAGRGRLLILTGLIGVIVLNSIDWTDGAEISEQNWTAGNWSKNLVEQDVLGCVAMDSANLPIQRFEGYRCSRFIDAVSQGGRVANDYATLERPTEIFRLYGLSMISREALIARLGLHQAQLANNLLLIDEAGNVQDVVRIIDFLEEISMR